MIQLLSPEHPHTQEPHWPLQVLTAQFGNSDDLTAAPHGDMILMPVPLVTLLIV